MALPSLDRTSLNEEWTRALDWVEANVGRVVGAERQTRWRPCYYLEVEREGELLPIYFRGDRSEQERALNPDALEREFRVMEFLESKGLKVPHIYGFCPDPGGIVMERCRGRSNLATAVDDTEREQVLDDYIAFMARMHAIPVEELQHLNLDAPTSPEMLALGDFDIWEQRFRAGKARPEPLIEFIIRWVRSRVPSGREQVSLLHGDSGQFMFENGKMTGVLDLELTYLGDPAADFAALLCRDLSEPLGDLRRALATYEKESGAPLDVRVVYYHAIRFGICTPMGTAGLVAHPSAELNWPQYETWYRCVGRVPLELLAHLEGIALEKPEIPEANPTRHAVGAHWLVENLTRSRDQVRESNPALHYEFDTALRVAQYLDRVQQYGAELEAQNRAEVAALVGRSPTNWLECDEMLEARALAALTSGSLSPEDEELVRCLYRQAIRQEFLLGPALSYFEGVEAQRLD